MSHLVRDEKGAFKLIHGQAVLAMDVYHGWEIRYHWGKWQGITQKYGFGVETQTFPSKQEVKIAIDIFQKEMKTQYGIKK